jgi:hypothetical protein
MEEKMTNKQEPNDNGQIRQEGQEQEDKIVKTKTPPCTPKKEARATNINDSYPMQDECFCRTSTEFTEWWEASDSVDEKPKIRPCQKEAQAEYVAEQPAHQEVER